LTSLVLDESLHTVSDKFHAQSEKQAAGKVTMKSWTTNWMHNSMEEKCYTIIGHMKLYAVMCVHCDYWKKMWISYGDLCN